MKLSPPAWPWGACQYLLRFLFAFFLLPDQLGSPKCPFSKSMSHGFSFWPLPLDHDICNEKNTFSSSRNWVPIAGLSWSRCPSRTFRMTDVVYCVSCGLDANSRVLLPEVWDFCNKYVSESGGDSCGPAQLIQARDGWDVECPLQAHLWKVRVTSPKLGAFMSVVGNTVSVLTQRRFKWGCFPSKWKPITEIYFFPYFWCLQSVGVVTKHYWIF